MPSHGRRFTRAFSIVVLLIALLGVGAAVASWLWLNRPLPLRSDVVELSIEPGTTPREIARQWVGAGVAVPWWMLYEYFRFSGDARRIRAGSYEIDSTTTPRRLLAKMVRGDVSSATVRLIEGWTFRQFRAELAKADSLKPTTASLSEEEIMAALGEPGVAPEGQFYPDTYSYSKGSTDLAVLKRAHRAMKSRLAAVWEMRAPDTPLRSPRDLLTLASIVEKETGRASDRDKVAAVFINRLKISMPLQTDPTVIYGLGSTFDGNLRKVDLLTDTPFNTYTRTGLPPTPISMPGKASLLATVRPAQSSALYFVARGDGSSVFSDDLVAHNRAVNQYQRGKPASSAE